MMTDEQSTDGDSTAGRPDDAMTSSSDASVGLLDPGLRFGAVVVNADIAGTLVFAATASYAAISFTSTAQWIGAVTAIVLFALGVFAFLWSYYNAVQRSRHEQISVTQLYLLAGPPTPSWVKVRMWAALAAQVAIALVTALARQNGPDGNPGSSLAVGFLVPMFGLGLNGLWAAFHGRFLPRETRDESPRRRTKHAGSDDDPADDDAAENDR